MGQLKDRAKKSATNIRAKVVTVQQKVTSEEAVPDRDIDVDIKADGLMDNLMSNFISKGGKKRR